MASENIDFSVIIPVFNSEKYLYECINSVQEQTHANFEIIIVNDGSTDSSLSIAKKMRKNDERIKIIDKTNSGVSSARNTGINFATGKYIIFIDSDDYLINNRSLEILKTTLDYGADAIIYDICFDKFLKKKRSAVYLDQDSIKEITSEVLIKIIKNEQINSVCNKVYKKSIIDKHNLRFNEEITMGEDLLFNVNYIKHCKTINQINIQLYFYRLSGFESLTTKYIPNKYSELMYVNDKMNDWATQYNNIKLISIIKYIRIKNIISCVNDFHRNNCTLSENEWHKLITKYKQDNKKIIVKKCGFLLFIFSILYTYTSLRLLSNVIALIKGVKK